MNLGQLRRRIRNQFGDTTGAHLTTQMVDDFINDGISEFIRDTMCVIKEHIFFVNADNNYLNFEYPAFSDTNNVNLDDLALEGGTADEDFEDFSGPRDDISPTLIIDGSGSEYDPNVESPAKSSFVQVQKVNRVVWWPNGEFNNSRVLRPVEEAGLDYTHGSNPDKVQGSPSAFYYVGGTLKLYPTPTVDGYVKVSVIPYPVELTAETDEPLLPQKYHRDIVTFAMWQASMMDADAERSVLFRQNWIEAKANARADQNNPSAYSYNSVSDIDVPYGPDPYGGGY